MYLRDTFWARAKKCPRRRNKYSEHTHALICKLLAPDPERRLGGETGAAQLREARALADVDWQQLAAGTAASPLAARAADVIRATGPAADAAAAAAGAGGGRGLRLLQVQKAESEEAEPPPFCVTDGASTWAPDAEWCAAHF